MKQLNLKESLVTEETDVYLLKVADAKKLKENENISEDPRSHYGGSKEFFNFDNTKMNTIAGGISNQFNIIIFDETKTDGKYNFVFKKSTLEDLYKDLKDFGLTLEKSKRNIEFTKYEMN